MIFALIGILFFFKSRKRKKLETDWDKSRDVILKFGVDHWVDQVRRLIVLEGFEKVLDVGSGDGQWLLALNKCGLNTFGIEPGIEIIKNTKKTLKKFGCEKNVTLKRAPAESIPYKNGEFDLIWCIGVFMFTQQQQTLSEFNRVLRKGGCVVISANGLGFFVMYLINGIVNFSLENITYGLNGMLNTFQKWTFGKQAGTCAVNSNEMAKLFKANGFVVKQTNLWLPHDLYPLEHFGFPTNYVYVAVKR